MLKINSQDPIAPKRLAAPHRIAAPSNTKSRHVAPNFSATRTTPHHVSALLEATRTARLSALLDPPALHPVSALLEPHRTAFQHCSTPPAPHPVSALLATAPSPQALFPAHSAHTNPTRETLFTILTQISSVRT
jgi:hypothetical protein